MIQPMAGGDGGLEELSASMGVEWMGSESDALDVTVKRVTKESIVVWVWMSCEDQEMV